MKSCEVGGVVMSPVQGLQQDEVPHYNFLLRQCLYVCMCVRVCVCVCTQVTNAVSGLTAVGGMMLAGGGIVPHTPAQVGWLTHTLCTHTSTPVYW